MNHVTMKRDLHHSSRDSGKPLVEQGLDGISTKPASWRLSWHVCFTTFALPERLLLCMLDAIYPNMPYPGLKLPNSFISTHPCLDISDRRGILNAKAWIFDSALASCSVRWPRIQVLVLHIYLSSIGIPRRVNLGTAQRCATKSWMQA